jgi:hypothetical protein
MLTTTEVKDYLRLILPPETNDWIGTYLLYFCEYYCVNNNNDYTLMYIVRVQVVDRSRV